MKGKHCIVNSCKIHNPKWLTFPRKEPKEIFSDLTAEPVASASLGQASCLGSQHVSAVWEEANALNFVACPSRSWAGLPGQIALERSGGCSEGRMIIL